MQKSSKKKREKLHKKVKSYANKKHTHSRVESRVTDDSDRRSSAASYFTVQSLAERTTRTVNVTYCGRGNSAPLLKVAMHFCRFLSMNLWSNGKSATVAFVYTKQFSLDGALVPSSIG